MDGIKVCIDRPLSPELVEKAYHRAIEENPRNRPAGLEFEGLSDQELALESKKLWRNGRTLRVAFLDGDPVVHEKVKEKAQEWSKYANIYFDFGDHAEAEIRISFRQNGSWSYIGTDALNIRKHQPTMNLGWLTAESEDEEIERVVVHEFGHALGCIHEHQNPATNIPWDEDKVYEYYGGSPNYWPKSEIFHNLLQKYSVESTQFSKFDPDSIMLYPVPNDLTVGDFEIGWNRQLSKQDIAFIQETYPKPDFFKTAIGEAVDRLDKQRATALCQRLAEELAMMDDPFPVPAAKSILSALRRKRYFDLMVEMADSFILNGVQNAQIMRQLGQAYIDTGNLNGALNILKSILDDPASPQGEFDEALGLIGRVYKQYYVNSKIATRQKKEQMMAAALENYGNAYDRNRQGNRWHGINVVALLARAQRDGIPVNYQENYRDIAETLMNAIEELDDEGNATLWDYGTAMEAAVALEDADSAIRWAEKYANSARIDAFELTSTLRQLEEVWDISLQDEIGQKIIPLLKAALLEAENGSVTLSFNEFNQLKNTAYDKNFERVFGNDSYKKIRWLQLALESCQNIGCVCKRDGTRIGTGFVLKGKDLSPLLEDDWYFLTNSHVITNDENVIKNSELNREPLRPEEAHITFELLFDEEPLSFRVSEIIWTSSPNQLDATLVRLEPLFYESVKKSFPISKMLPDPAAKPRIYIAGHPGKGGLTISLHDNHLIEFDDTFIHYRTPTDPGSSGSPVFNDQWELVGLHHAGSAEKKSLGDPTKRHEANEGIRINAILEKILR